MDYEFSDRFNACAGIDNPILFHGFQFTARQLLQALGVFCYHHAVHADTRMEGEPDIHNKLLDKAWSLMGLDAGEALTIMLNAESDEGKN